MGLFFFISGYWVLGSLAQGKKAFVTKRLVRHGVPVIVGVLVIMPLEMWVHFRFFFSNQPLDFLPYYYQVYLGIAPPAGLVKSVVFPEINLGHLWFIENLLVFSLGDGKLGCPVALV